MANNDLKIALKIMADASQAISATSNLSNSFVGLANKIGDMFGHQALNAMKKYTYEAANLNRELTRISQTAESGIQSIGGMNKAIFESAKLTGIDYKDILGGYGRLAAGGMNVEEIKSAMKHITNSMVVSTANSEQLSSALMVASRSFGLDMTTDSESILDKMYQAGKLGNAELEDLSMILSRVGPQAKLAGLGLSETLSFIEGMANSMESAEIVSTMSRAVLRMFSDPQLRKNVEKNTGAQFFNTETQQRNNIFDIFGQIQNAYLATNTDLERSKLFEKIFQGADERTKNGLLSILNDSESVKNMRNMYKEIDQSAGTIKKDMKDMMNNMVAQTGRMKANFAEITTGAGSVLDKSVTPLLRYFNDVMIASDNNELLSAGALAGGAGLGLLAVLNTFGAFRGGIAGKIGSATGGIFAGKMYEQMAGVQPVYVVNMPQGFGGSGNPIIPGLGGLGTGAAAAIGGKKLISGFKASRLALAMGATTSGIGTALSGLGVHLGGLVGLKTGAAGALAGAGAAGLAATGGLLAGSAAIGVGIGSLFNVISDGIAKQLTGKTLTDSISDTLAAMFSENYRKNALGEFGISREEAIEKMRIAKEKREMAIQNKVDVYIDIDKDGRLIDMRKYEHAGTIGTFGDLLSARFAF